MPRTHRLISLRGITGRRELMLHLLFRPSLFFFFSSRRRHTRFDCDWSSDVCSSDLIPIVNRDRGALREDRQEQVRVTWLGRGEKLLDRHRRLSLPEQERLLLRQVEKGDRKSVV